MTGPRIATAVAHPNIALVKYWGKRDDALILPHQSSLSMTLAPLQVQTTVELGVSRDEVVLHGKAAQGDPLARVLALARRVSPDPVRVVSDGNFPMAAGLASSAAGFAALAVALQSAAGLPPDVRDTSRLARLGSGSACRSVQGGFCVWRRGSRADGEDSFAEQVAPASAWPELRMVAAILSESEKPVSSRDGMKTTVATSPYFEAWCQSAEAEIGPATEAIRKKDLPALGALAERNAWRMHCTALAAQPALCYLLPETLRIIEAVRQAREKDGLPVWFTLDAGPNPVLLTSAVHEARVMERAKAWGVRRLVACIPGLDARLLPLPAG